MEPKGRRALIAAVWTQFHRLWGLAKEQRYDKREWSKLQELLSDLLRSFGLSLAGVLIVNSVVY